MGLGRGYVAFSVISIALHRDNVTPDFAEAFEGFEGIALALLASLQNQSHNDSEGKA